MTGEQLNFNADVAQLIHLVTHSMYSNKEVFLRELIANASDAIQKAKRKHAMNPSYLGKETALDVSIEVDTEKSVITIRDSGVGMTKDEVIENLGTIAKSGTKAFLEQLKDMKEQKNDLIGQFGIGFYSAFMVANIVEVETKSAESEEAVLWRSKGGGTYELLPSDKKTRGTEIRLFLHDEAKEFADAYRLRSLIVKHANYVPVPIMMKEMKDGKETDQWQQINKMQSLRTRQKSEIKKEEYKEFYSSLTYDHTDPLETIHLTIEGAVTFKALLFIPKNAPLFGMQQSEQDYGPSLYVQNVMIMEHAKELLPVRLRFVKGVVETPDLPLNVSRELIQSSAVLSKIQKTLVKEIMKSMSRYLTNERAAYLEFYKNFGRYLKEGVHYSHDQKEEIASLLVFESYRNNKLVTLQEYIGEEKEAENNKDAEEKKSPVYYLTGGSLSQLRVSPYLEMFKTTDVDVLLMDDPIDERVVGALPMYKQHLLISATNSDIDLGNEDEATKEQKKKEREKQEAENKDFLTFVHATVGTDKLEKVTFTDALKESLGILVSKEGQTSAQMERIMQAMGQEVEKSKRILSLNSAHPLVQKMMTTFETDTNAPLLKDLILHAYEQAILLEGGMIDDMSGFLQRANRLLVNGGI